MSVTEGAPAKETTGNDRDASLDGLKQVEQRVEALEDVISDQAETISELKETVEKQEETIDDQAETINEQANEIDELSGDVEKLDSRLDHGEKKAGHLTEDIADLESQLEQLSPGSDSPGADGEHPENGSTMLPIERVSRLEEAETEIEITPSIERAITLFEHWQDWSTNTQKGRVLKENQKTLLRTATGENLSWRQVYRACEALHRLSKEQITFRQHSEHGWMLIEREPRRRRCQSSSATAT